MVFGCLLVYQICCQVCLNVVTNAALYLEILSVIPMRISGSNDNVQQYLSFTKQDYLKTTFTISATPPIMWKCCRLCSSKISAKYSHYVVKIVTDEPVKHHAALPSKGLSINSSSCKGGRGPQTANICNFICNVIIDRY